MAAYSFSSNPSINPALSVATVKPKSGVPASVVVRKRKGELPSREFALMQIISKVISDDQLNK